MIAEIIATGDEVRTGALVDSNSAYIAETLTRIGVDVFRHHTVGDNLQALIDLFTEVGRRAEAAVVTGGLGPTQDDLTAAAAAAAAGRELALDASVLSGLELFGKERGRVLSPSNKKQAYLPQGAGVLHNPVGTAPGFQLRIGGCVFFCLPGVPHEMKKMLDDQVLPILDAMQGQDHHHHLMKILSTFGLPESVVGEKMLALPNLFPGVTVGLRASFPEIQVKLYLTAADRREGETVLSRAQAWAAGQLKDHLFTDEGLSMAAAVGKLLLERRETLALAESCTGGLVANWITNNAGASDYFLLSAVTYADKAKIDVLGVSPETLRAAGAVHEETAAQMAKGARDRSGATYGVGITGIAGPGGGTPEKPMGTVCIAVATNDGTLARRHTFSYGRRLMNKKMFAAAALDMLRRVIVGDLRVV